MTNPVSTTDGVQRVDVALLVGDAGYRYGILHFPLADTAPTEETFDTVGAYEPAGGRGLGVASDLSAHTVSVRLSPPDAPTEVLLDARSMTEAVAEGASWSRTVPVGDGRLRYECALTTAPDDAQLTARLCRGDAVWFTTTVHTTRSSDGESDPTWVTSHGWSAETVSTT